MYKSLLVRGQWVTGENEYGYPVGERLPLHTPFQKFNWLRVNGLLSSDPPLKADLAIEKDSSSEGGEIETAPVSLEETPEEKDGLLEESENETAPIFLEETPKKGKRK